MRNLIFILSMGFSTSIIAQESSICTSNNPIDYQDSDENYVLFLYYQSYQIYPSYTPLKRDLLRKNLIETQSTKVCFETDDLNKSVKILGTYLKTCFHKKYSTRHLRERDVIEVFNPNNAQSKHALIKRCSY